MRAIVFKSYRLPVQLVFSVLGWLSLISFMLLAVFSAQTKPTPKLALNHDIYFMPDQPGLPDEPTLIASSATLGVLNSNASRLKYRGAKTKSFVRILKSSSTFKLKQALPGSGLFAIDVSIDGGNKVPFILDTGATTSVLFAQHLIKSEQNPDQKRITKVHGIASVTDRPVRFIESLSIGGHISERLNYKNLNLPILPPLEPIEGTNRIPLGILGLDILSDHVIYYDHKEQMFYFIKRKNFTPKSVPRWHKIGLNSNPFTEKEDELKFMNLRLLGNVVPALLDTGASVSFMTWNTGEIPQIKKIKQRMIENYEIQGGTGEFNPRILVKMDGFRIDSKFWGPQDAIVDKLDSLQILGFGDKPLFIASASLLRDEDFILDLAKNALFIKRKKSNRFVLSPTASGVTLNVKRNSP